VNDNALQIEESTGDELLELAERLSSLPDGSLLALSMYGPGERTLVVSVNHGTVTVAEKLDAMPTAALAFPAEQLTTMLRVPDGPQQLLDAGKLRPRGNPTLSTMALAALGATPP
jgi:hypothetical protein